MKTLNQLGRALILASALTAGCASINSQAQHNTFNSVSQPNKPLKTGLQPDGSYIYCSDFHDMIAAQEESVLGARAGIEETICGTGQGAKLYGIPVKLVRISVNETCAQAFRSAESSIDCNK